MADTDLELIQGDTEVIDATITDGAGTALNTNNLLALHFRVKASTDDADEDAVIALALGSGIEPDGPPSSGGIRITLSADDTRSLTAGRWVYDLQIEESGGRISTVLRGRIKALPDVHIGA